MTLTLKYAVSVASGLRSRRGSDARRCVRLASSGRSMEVAPATGAAPSAAPAAVYAASESPCISLRRVEEVC